MSLTVSYGQLMAELGGQTTPPPKKTHHVALEYVVHDLVSWESCCIHQQLECEFQAGVHFPPSSFSLAFFPSSLLEKS